MFDDRAAAMELIEQRRQAGITDRLISPDWRRDLPAPATNAPDGACDAHIHIVGPQRNYPINEHHPYDHLSFDDSTVDDWLGMAGRLNLSRALHVHSMTYGFNYQIVLNTAFRFPDQFRAVVAVYPDITDKELEVLEGAGVIGARFSSPATPILDAGLVMRLAERGWQQHYVYREEHLETWGEVMLAAPGTFVIEHFGGADPSTGTASTAYAFLIRALDTGRCWVKMTTRRSEMPGPPYTDLDPIVTDLVTRYPDRVLWGTDWPHVQHFRPIPSDAALLDDLFRWVDRDHDLFRRILVDNPSEAFNWPFGPTSGPTA